MSSEGIDEGTLPETVSGRRRTTCEWASTRRRCWLAKGLPVDVSLAAMMICS